MNWFFSYRMLHWAISSQNLPYHLVRRNPLSLEMTSSCPSLSSATHPRVVLSWKCSNKTHLLQHYLVFKRPTHQEPIEAELMCVVSFLSNLKTYLQEKKFPWKKTLVSKLFKWYQIYIAWYFTVKARFALEFFK